MFCKTALFALFASIASAQLHAPVGEPKGNNITRPLNEIIPVGTAFTITWIPTTSNSVSVLLLKGPATNVKPFGAPIAEGIANSGSLSWTPSSSLEDTAGSPTGYGIQIIDDVSGQYQYSTQFGISAPAGGVSSAVASSTGGNAGYPVASTPAPSAKHSSVGGYPTASVHNSIVTKASTVIYSTGMPHANTSVIQPTRSLSVPASLRPTASGNATTSRLPEATGAASAVQAGLSLAGVLAAFAFML